MAIPESIPQIPFKWWDFCDMAAWKRQSAYFPYRADPRVQIVPIEQVTPPTRESGDPYKKHKLVPILLAFQSLECALPPVEIRATSGSHFEVHNGFHRYYASIAVGYTHIPAIIVDGQTVEA